MRLLYSKLFLMTAVLGIAACADDSTTTETGPSTPPPMFTGGSRPEGELFGSFYNNGVRIQSGTPFHISLTPLDAATQSRLRDFSDEQTATVLFTSKAHYGWYDPIASDGPCTNVGAIDHAANVSFYLSGGRSNPDGTPTDPAYAEIHTPDWNPSNTVDGHCIRPGRYSLEISGQGAYSGTIPVDYIAYETIPGYGPGIQITQTDRSFPAYLESDAYSASDTYDDLIVHFDKTAQPSAKRAPEIAYDVQAAYSTSTFTPGTATASVGSVVRIRTSVASPVGDANSYLVRNWWDYGTTPSASGGFYSAGDGGRFLRWKAVAGSSDRCLILGADAKHMSNPIETAPTSYVRIGVGRACFSGQDLVIGAVSAGWNGTTVAPQLKISNVTGTAYTGTATANVYLSTDQVFGGDLALGSQAISLNVGAAATQSVTLSGLTVPPTGATYYVFVVLSGVTGENEISNNTMWDPAFFVAPVPPPQADLRVTSITGPSSVALYATGAYTYTLNVRNHGTAGTGSTVWYHSLAMSSDAVFSANDPRVYGGSGPGPLAPFGQLGDAGMTSVYFLPPATAVPGTVYLVANLDTTNTIAESNETNNTGASAAITLTANGDMRVDSLAGPASIAPGATTTIPVFVKNYGTDPARPAKVKVYLSTDNTLSAGDSLIGWLMDTPLMTAGTVRTENVSVTVAAGQAVGNYYLIAKVDADSTVYESNEGNNTTVRTGQVSIAVPSLPDLIVNVVIQQRDSAFYPNSYLWIKGTARNIGTATAASGWVGRLYLSTDATLDGADELVGSITFGSLAPNTNVSIATTATVPVNAWGNYYLLYVVDASGVISESNEGNNTGISAGTMYVEGLP